MVMEFHKLLIEEDTDTIKAVEDLKIVFTDGELKYNKFLFCLLNPSFMECLSVSTIDLVVMASQSVKCMDYWIPRYEDKRMAMVQQKIYPEPTAPSQLSEQSNISTIIKPYPNFPKNVLEDLFLFECNEQLLEFVDSSERSTSKADERTLDVDHNNGCDTNNGGISSRSRPEQLGICRTYFDEGIICDLCGFLTKSYQNLRKHKNVHHKSDLKIYECSECKKTFKHKYLLTAHETSHNAPNLKCDQCDTKFKRRSHLVAHSKKKHANAAVEFKCEICYKKFGCKFTLSRHMKTNHSHVELSCKVCKRMFNRGDSLKRHMITCT